jgi:hypothetical protein
MEWGHVRQRPRRRELTRRTAIRLKGFPKGFSGLVAACLLGIAILSLPALSMPAWAQEGVFPDSKASTFPYPRAPEAAAASLPRRAQFLNQAAPDAVRHMADWVTDSADNGSLPFAILDKPAAKVFVFDKNGQLLGTASVLVGLAPGDDSVPGIGTMPLKAITPDMRTTPAGRFVAALGHDLGKLDVLWVDYPDAISMHRVINTNPKEHRLQRIVSPAPAEHRISYGCINVPAKFFDSVVDPTFKDTKGVVYILPEIKPMQAVFPAYYEPDAKSGLQDASGTGTVTADMPSQFP